MTLVHRKKIGFAALFLQALYCLATSVWLNGNQLKNAVNTKPEEVRVDWDWAISLFPGFAYVHHPSVRVQDSNIQMYLELPSVSVFVFLPSLTARKFETSFLYGSGLNFRLRLRREKSKISAELRNRLPPIPGIASLEKPTVPAVAGKLNETAEASQPWLLGFSRLWIRSVSEIWIEDYRFSGSGEISGGFQLTPGKGASVEPSQVRILSGNLFFGENRVVEKMSAQINASVHPFLSHEVPGLKIFDFVSAQISGNAQVGNMRFLNYYLNRLPWLRLDGGEGALTMNLNLKKGVLQSGSQLSLNSNHLKAHLFRQTASGQGVTTWEIEDNESGKRGTLRLQFNAYHVSHPHYHGAGIVGSRFSITVHTPDLQLSQAFPRLGVIVDIPDAKINDLSYFNAYLPQSSGLRFTGGKGLLSCRFEADAHPDWNDKGHLTIEGHEAQVTYGPFSLKGNATISATLRKGSIQAGHFDLSGTRVTLSQIEATRNQEKGETLNGWWGEAVLRQGQLKTSRPAALDGTLRMRSQDARPLIALFTSRAALPKLVRNFLAFEGLQASAQIRLSDKAFVIPGLSAKGGGTKLHGWFEKKPEKEEGKLLLEYGPFATGLELKDGHLGIKLNDAYGWFEGRHHKPKTSESVSPDSAHEP